jgi:hypothetical protein
MCKRKTGILTTSVLCEECVFWDVTQCSFCNSLRFGVTYRLHHQGEKISALGTSLDFPPKPVTYCYVPSSLILFTLMMNAIHSSET